jgi:threonyl-tRNA synthetase
MQNKISNIDAKRHTLAHLTAQAVRELYPQAQNAIGPNIENGWYQDFDLGTTTITDKDLETIEKTIKKNLANWTEFTKKEVTKDEALQEFSWNIYKSELINDFTKDAKTLTFYTCGGFVDLCKGGHCEHPAKEISPDSFKLEKVAGAYWKGDASNKMLTRIYGLAFDTKEELDKYIWQQEEAKKRDHRILGPKLKLFTTSELVGPGLPLFQKNGNILRRELTEYLWSMFKEYNNEWVWTPHMTKEALYQVSGHAGHYLEDMFSVFGGTSKEKFWMKPMNCPFHMELFKDNNFSYRDMPVRYFEPATVYRDEKSGQLGGLTRVRALTQDDGHVFCRMSQIEQEIEIILTVLQKFYTTMGMINDYKVRLSLRDEDKSKWLGTDEMWATAQKALTNICKNKNLPYYEGPGEAAFYGPKLDFMFKDAIGRDHQLATIQCDFNQPARFELSFTNEKGEKEMPVVIHRAIAGSLERFLGVAIEHFAGSFPVWLSPVQVSIVPVNNEYHLDFANEIYKKLKEKNVRVELDDSKESLGKRIRAAKEMKTPYVIVIGDKEKTSGNLTVETRKDKIENISIEDFANKVETEIRERTLN